MVSSGLCLRERFKLRSNNRRFNIRMYRGVATALVAPAAFDYLYLDRKYLHVVQAVANSLLHFFLPEAGGQKAPVLATDLATQLLGTGWLTEGRSWDDQAKNPAGSSLNNTAWDYSGRKQRFTKPLLAQRCDGLSLLLCHVRPPPHRVSERSVR